MAAASPPPGDDDKDKNKNKNNNKHFKHQGTQGTPLGWECDGDRLEKGTTPSPSPSTDHRTHGDDGEPDKDKKEQNEASDPNIVDWDGPNDPTHPRNWSKGFKFANIALVSLSVLYCNLATTMFAPGAPLMQQEFGYRSETLEVLTITIASLGFAVGQLFVPPLSEVFGRMVVYRISAVLYLGFTAGCARSTHVAEFLVFRICTGLSAACYMSTGGGTIADLLPKENRALAMSSFTAGPLLGPVLGPIIGGFLSAYLGWRWCFYLILIIAGTVSAASFIVLRETSYVTILKAKAKRLANETGNPNLRAAGDKQTPVRSLVYHALLRPTKFLILSPIVLLMALYVAFNFGVTMLLFATFPTVFEHTYGWSVSISGLAYVGVGVGCFTGILIFANFSDRLLNNKKDGQYQAERRLILMMLTSWCYPCGLFIYGWTTQYKVQWVVPIIGTAICGPGGILLNSCAQAYIIDVFGPAGAASALAAVTFLRNLTGAFLPLASPALYANLGLGWGNSVLAFITLAFIPVPFWFYAHGKWLREKFPVTA